MKATFQAVNFTADGKLISFIQYRLNKLETYYDRVLKSEVYLKVDNTPAKDNKLVEVKAHLPGQELMVKKQAKSFEHATDKAVEALRRQLRKHKEKHLTSV